MTRVEDHSAVEYCCSQVHFARQGLTAIDLFRLSGDVDSANALEGACNKANPVCFILSSKSDMRCDPRLELGAGALLELNQKLVHSAFEGNSEEVGKLIDDGADVDWVAPAGHNSSTGTALHCASRRGHEETVNVLLQVRACSMRFRVRIVTLSFSGVLA
jgi:hypothetical protein